jgi:hypothetical protein
LARGLILTRRWPATWGRTHKTRIPPSAASAKPPKPNRDFPLYAHANGQWARRILGKVHYFGPWSDPDAALERCLRDKDDLLTGREPANGDGLTLRDLANRFLTSKKR